MGTYFKFTGSDLEYVWEQGRVRAANAGEGDGTEGVTVNLIVPSIKVNTQLHMACGVIVEEFSICWK